jgi:hypothetical protein
MTQLLTEIINYGGATFDQAINRLAITEGYMVALSKEHEDFCAVKNLDKLLEKKLRKFSKLAQKHDCLIGVWVNKKEGRVYFDLVENEPSLDNAIYKATQRQQKAIYDCAAQKDILV